MVQKNFVRQQLIERLKIMIMDTEKKPNKSSDNIKDDQLKRTISYE